VRESAVSRWGPRVNYRGLSEAIRRYKCEGAINFEAFRANIRSSPLNASTISLQVQATSALEALMLRRREQGAPIHLPAATKKLQFAPVVAVLVSASPYVELVHTSASKHLLVTQLVFKKTKPLDEYSGPMCAVVVEEAVRQTLGTALRIDIEVVDVFTGRAYRSPGAKKRVMTRLQAGLSGLRAHWAEVLGRIENAA
jgi:hypothetical protein